MLRIDKPIVENSLANGLLETGVADIVVMLYNSSKAVVCAHDRVGAESSIRLRKAYENCSFAARVNACTVQSTTEFRTSFGGAM